MTGRHLQATPVAVDSAEWATAAALLERAALPTDDLADGTARLWSVHDASSGAMVGCFGLELADPEALLRSVVVRPERQRQGLGTAVVELAEATARDLGVRRLVLLTEDASAFFERLGYREFDRAEACEPIRQTEQFRTLCPASAACLSKSISVG